MTWQHNRLVGIIPSIHTVCERFRGMNMSQAGRPFLRSPVKAEMEKKAVSVVSFA